MVPGLPLNGKTAVIYGGGGNIGGAIAEAFVEAGADVHLLGRTEAMLKARAEQLNARYALDEEAVDRHAATLERLDISVDVITDNDVQGTSLHKTRVADYLRPGGHERPRGLLRARGVTRHLIRPRTASACSSRHRGGTGAPLRDLARGSPRFPA